MWCSRRCPPRHQGVLFFIDKSYLLFNLYLLFMYIDPNPTPSLPSQQQQSTPQPNPSHHKTLSFLSFVLCRIFFWHVWNK